MTLFDELKLQVLGSNEGFALGFSKLNIGILNNAEEDWLDYLCDTTNIQVSRGGTPALFSAQLSAGTLNFRLYNSPLDPALRPNRPMRLLARVGSDWMPLFTGVIQDLSQDYSKENNDTWINILAVDGVSSLANTPRYGAIANGSDSFEARIKDLNKSALTPVADPVPMSFDPYFLPKTAYESSLANHYTQVCDSTGGVWWVDTSNVAQFYRNPDDAANFPVLAHFSDVHSTGDPLHVCLNDAVVSYDTRNVVNMLQMSNTGGIDSEGNSIVTNYLFENLTSIASWGPRAYALETNLAGSGVYELRAQEILEDFSGVQRRVKSVRFNAKGMYALLSTLDVYSKVNVTFKGDLYTCRISSIVHDITPERHMVTLELL